MMRSKNKQKKNLRSMTILMITACLSITGCSSSQSSEDSDVITQKKTADGRTQITVLTKYAFTINDFEKKVEEKFPDIDIVLVGDYTANTALAKEYEARLKHDDLTDIVMTWPYDIGETYWEDRLIDMAGMSFTNKYNVSMLDTIADDEGNLFYLPGPASIRGIIYNKTMFEENGWKVPSNYDEFAALCKQIEASGNTAFQLPLGNEEVLDTAFVGFNYGNSYSKPDDASWLANYDEGKGKFLDHFAGAVDNFQALIDDGILHASDLSLTYSDTQSNLFTRKNVMTEDSVQLIKLAETIGGSSDEYGMMPFFNKDPANTWARLYMVCYIGMNKHLQDSGNEDKYKKVLKVMDYISTEEGQEALSSGNGAMFSSLKNVAAPDDVEIENVLSTLNQGRYGVFPTLKRSESALRRGLRGILEKTVTKEQLGEMVDKENQIPTRIGNDKSYGEASEDFSLTDTGSFVSDVIRKTCKSDFALYLDNGKDGLYNGKGISAKFYKGSITETDLKRVLPDYKHEESGEILKVKMTGENLVKALEYTLPVDKNSGWFYYFSGLKIEFDPVAKQGARILSIETSDGEKIEDKKVYEVAIEEGSVAEEYISSSKKTGIFTVDLIKDEIQKEKTITPAKDGRFLIKEQ